MAENEESRLESMLSSDSKINVKVENVYPFKLLEAPCSHNTSVQEPILRPLENN